MKKRILIVDDEKDLVELLQLRIEAEGFEVDVAYDGEEALSKAKADIPDLIVLDIMMPKVNGFEVCRTLKKNPATQSVKIIMVTAKTREEDRFWGLEAGADEYITKPFDFVHLLGKIKKSVGEK